MSLSSQDINWIAGICEGEGCFILMGQRRQESIRQVLEEWKKNPSRKKTQERSKLLGSNVTQC